MRCDRCGHPRHLLQLVPEPPLPEVSGSGTRALAGRSQWRVVAGSLFPRGLHNAPTACSACFAKQAADLWNPFQGGVGNVARSGSRPEAARSKDRLSRRAPHLGPELTAEPSLIMPAIIFLLILKEQLRLVVGATPSQNQLTGLPKPLQNAANRFCV